MTKKFDVNKIYYLFMVFKYFSMSLLYAWTHLAKLAEWICKRLYMNNYERYNFRIRILQQ